jgi:hypothetical protein
VRTARTLEEEWRLVLPESVGAGAKEDESITGRILAAGFLHVTARSRLARVLKLMKHLFLYFSVSFSGRGKLRITEIADTE